MKILKNNSSQFDYFKNTANSSRMPYIRKKGNPEFDYYLEELLKDDAKDFEEYPILLPRHGRFWDNGYEDIE